jgi:glycosyltransferase involved in cell wall biosynthesis
MSFYRIRLFLQRVKKAFNIFRQEGFKGFILSIKKYNLRKKGKDDFSYGMSSFNNVYDSSPVKFKGKKISVVKFLTMLDKLTFKSIVIAISQDDYLRVVGGIQVKLIDQQMKLNSDSVAFLHLSPYKNRESLDHSGLPGIMRINFNGKFLGFADDQTFTNVLSELVKREMVTEMHLHHLMGWKISYIKELLSIVGDIPSYFWLHDFFSICVKYTLLRNNREYCHAPDPHSNSCRICRYGSLRPNHYQAFAELFKLFSLKVLAPSEFALELWRTKFPVSCSEGYVEPNASIKWADFFHEVKKDQPLRIAFVGYPMMHKGWNAWLNLTDQFGKDPRYEFFHFSSDWQKSSNFDKIAVSVTKQNRNAMTDALRENCIDIAFLWSVWPETFSFTLYESLAAGCYIVTNPLSGNIQYTILQHPNWGYVYENEADLLRAFDEESIIKAFQKFNATERRTGKMIL